MRLFSFLCVIALVLGCKNGQPTPESSDQAQNEESTPNPVKEHFSKMEQDALKETYKGVFSGEAYEHLFPIKATNVSTEPIVEAANAFLKKLSPTQLEATTFSIDADEWRKWSNVDNGIYERQGISLKAMDAEQKEVAFYLMQTSLSAKGLQLSKDIMKTDQTLRELNNGSTDYDEELYFLTLMGEPSTTEPWGWQLDGHHLVINYFVLGDQIVMSPVFMGAEPVLTTTGKYAGNTLFQDEQNLGLSFMLSLSEDEQKSATIAAAKKGNNITAEANKDNLTLNYEGLHVKTLSNAKKEKLQSLIFQYISNMREGHQTVKMEEILEHFDDTWFAWVGETDEEAVFYYRIHSPVVLIEFDHQIAVGVPNSDRSAPTRNHIHTVVRTPNGNDYGKDLLQQHLEQHHQH